MKTRRLRAAALVVVSLAACGGGSSEDPAASSGSAPEEVTGVITSVERDDGGGFSSFDVREGERTYEILIDPELDYGFPLGHLEEHRKTEAPVLVELDERDGELYATSILDAPE